jgi:hypothetical protein
MESYFTLDLYLKLGNSYVLFEAERYWFYLQTSHYNGKFTVAAFGEAVTNEVLQQ